jgi:steroid delta-isomerase-like uncharacterized protein
MSASENSVLARRWFNEVWNDRRDATVHELLADDAVGHLEGLTSRGVAEFLAMRSSLLGAFPNFHMTVEETAAEGDNVVVRWSANGTHDGELLGIAATSKQMDFRGITWLRFANGRIVEGWDAWNQGALKADLEAAADARSRS